MTGSIFAYGQTSSGKTYTMTGITEFAVADIFDYIFQVQSTSDFFPQIIYSSYVYTDWIRIMDGAA